MKEERLHRERRKLEKHLATIDLAIDNVLSAYGFSPDIVQTIIRTNQYKGKPLTKSSRQLFSSAIELRKHLSQLRQSMESGHLESAVWHAIAIGGTSVQVVKISADAAKAKLRRINEGSRKGGQKKWTKERQEAFSESTSLRDQAIVEIARRMLTDRKNPVNKRNLATKVYDELSLSGETPTPGTIRTILRKNGILPPKKKRK